MQYVLMNLCMKYFLYTPKCEAFNVEEVYNIAIRNNFDDSCILLRSNYLDNKRGDSDDILGGAADRTNSKSNKKEEKKMGQDFSAAFLMTAAESAAVDYVLFKDPKFSHLRTDKMEKEIATRTKELEGRMINTLLTWQEDKESPLLTLISQLDQVDEELAKMESLLEEQNESLMTMQNGLIDIQLHNEKLDTIVHNQLKVKETITGVLSKLNISDADLQVMKSLRDTLRGIPEELNGMAPKVLKYGYEKAMTLLEGKSSEDSTTGLLAVVRLGKWLKNAFSVSNGTNSEFREIKNLKAVEERTAELQGIKLAFTARVDDFISDLIKGSVPISDNSANAALPYAPAKRPQYNSIVLIAPLVTLCVELEPASLNRILAAYTSTCSSVYRPEHKEQMKMATKDLKLEKHVKGKMEYVGDAAIGKQEAEIAKAAEFITSDKTIGVIFLKSVARLRELVESETAFLTTIFSKSPSAIIPTVATLFEQASHDLEKRLILNEFRSDFHLLTMMAAIENASSSPNRVLHSILSPLKTVISEQSDAFLAKVVIWITDQNPDGRYLGIFTPMLKLPIWIDHMLAAMDLGRREDGSLPESVKTMAVHGFDAVIKAIFTQLRSIAEKREKYTTIILMENFYFFNTTISARDAFKEHEELFSSYVEEAIKTQTIAMTEYIWWIVREQYEKVYDFFLEVEGILEKGGDKISATQVEQAKTLMPKFVKVSKLEAKNAEKNAKLMWQRVDKHLCLEAQLLDTVWRSLEIKFIKRWVKWETYATKVFGDSLQPTSGVMQAALHAFADKPSTKK
jgi:hypothetical protein